MILLPLYTYEMRQRLRQSRWLAIIINEYSMLILEVSFSDLCNLLVWGQAVLLSFLAFSPKCRSQYSQRNIPTRYLCFCGKKIDPEFDPWLPPHSCGEVCGRKLQPLCGHSCLLLCHPGELLIKSSFTSAFCLHYEWLIENKNKDSIASGFTFN